MQFRAAAAPSPGRSGPCTNGRKVRCHPVHAQAYGDSAPPFDRLLTARQVAISARDPP